MAFSKKKVEDRKQWLQAFSPGTFLDHTADTISYSQFVHKVCWCVGGCRQGGLWVAELLGWHGPKPALSTDGCSASQQAALTRLQLEVPLPNPARRWGSAPPICPTAWRSPCPCCSALRS